MEENEKRRLGREGWSKLIETLALVMVISAFIAWIIGEAFHRIDRELLLLIAGALSMCGLFVMIKRQGG